MLLSGVLWLLWGTCACSGFVIGVASLLVTLEFGLASVASDIFGDAAAIEEGGGGVSS